MNPIKNTCRKIITYSLALFAMASCKNNSSTTGAGQNDLAYKPPVVTPLVFSKSTKINWAKLKTFTLTPVVKKFDIGQVPSQSSADTNDFRPFNTPVQEIPFDYNALPSKDFYINKLPSKPLKFDTLVLPSPKVIKAGPPFLSTKGKGVLFELGESQGLSGLIVSCLFTDRDGFLWIATDKGVYRYDGQNLVLFIPNPMQQIFDMLQDSAGRLWISSLGGGIEVLDTRTGVLSALTTKNGLAHNKVIKIVTDSRQRIWASSGGGINIIDTENKTISTLGQSQGLSFSSADFLVKDNRNNIWAATGGGGIDVIDPVHNKIRYISTRQGFKTNSFAAMTCDKQGRIWACSLVSENLTVFDGQNNKMQFVNEAQCEGVFVNSLTVDNDDNVWVGAFNNFTRVINLDKKLIKTVAVSPGRTDLTNVMASIVEDKTGNVWLGSVRGLYLYKKNEALVEREGDDIVFTSMQDSTGLLWGGSNNGVSVFDRKSKTMRRLTAKNGLTNDTAGTITQQKGKILISTTTGLDIIDPNNKTMAMLTRSQGLRGNLGAGAAIDHNGNYWIL
jgi:ligand-binding sensor domain-containing protein